jgi:hypothetical protein
LARCGAESRHEIGKAEADKRVERSLYERANGYSYDAVKIFMPAGAKKPVYAPYVEHVPPDTTAAIFWLKNRDPAQWRDAWQLEHVMGKYTISDKPMTEEQWIKERAIRPRGDRGAGAGVRGQIEVSVVQHLWTGSRSGRRAASPPWRRSTQPSDAVLGRLVARCSRVRRNTPPPNSMQKCLQQAFPSYHVGRCQSTNAAATLTSICSRAPAPAKQVEQILRFMKNNAVLNKQHVDRNL